MLRIGAEISVGFRSAKARLFRGAKGDNTTVIDAPILIIEELYRLAEAFTANRLEYAVCGGLAMAIHGRLRLTVDIDVVVAAQEIPRAAEIAARVGFDDVSG